MKKSISIVTPAYNEEKELEYAITEVNKVVSEIFDDYEILLFDDCSTDKTGEIADKLAQKIPNLRVFHNKKNMNMGYNFRMGIKHAKKDYIMLFSGPESNTFDTIKEFLLKVGEVPVLTSYIENARERPIHRRLVSHLVTSALNIMFGLNRKYYFGMQAYETKILKNTKITTNSFGVLIETLIRSVKAGYPNKEIPYEIRVHKLNTSSSALRPRNVLSILSMVIRLFWDIQIKRNKKRIS